MVLNPATGSRLAKPWTPQLPPPETAAAAFMHSRSRKKPLPPVPPWPAPPERSLDVQYSHLAWRHDGNSTPRRTAGMPPNGGSGATPPRRQRHRGNGPDNRGGEPPSQYRGTAVQSLQEPQVQAHRLPHRLSSPESTDAQQVVDPRTRRPPSWAGVTSATSISGPGKRMVFADLDVLAVGPVAREVQAAFNRYWNHESVVAAEAVVGKGGTERRQANAAGIRRREALPEAELLSQCRQRMPHRPVPAGASTWRSSGCRCGCCAIRPTR